MLGSGFQLKDWFAQEPCEEPVPVCAAAPTRVVPPATGTYESLTRQALSSSADQPGKVCPSNFIRDSLQILLLYIIYTFVLSVNCSGL